MKKTILITTISIALISVLGAQNRIHTPSLQKSELKSSFQRSTDQVNQPNFLFSAGNFGPVSTQRTEYSNGIIEEIIGETYYDLQTNNSIQNRLFTHSDGTISAAWTMNLERQPDPELKNRGTGYNHYDGTSWGAFPTSRIDKVKTGWPSLSEVNNKIIIASHANEREEVNLVTKNEGWTEAKYIPKSGRRSLQKKMWPRMKVGGPDGKTIHVINHTFNTNVDSNLVAYNRSLDGGETWDIVDSILPGTGREHFNHIDADAYAMDVRGETIAFVLGDDWTDIVLMKSTDNGTTWTKRVIRDHPIENFNDSVLVDSTTYPDSKGIIDNADGSFSLSIDDAGIAHVFFGLMSYSNEVRGDKQWEYYPFSDGIMYWNEFDNKLKRITGTLDLNGDEILNINNKDHIANYNMKSLSSFPSSTFDENGHLYLTYSSIIETFYQLQIDMGNNGPEKYLQHYRHQYLIKSEDYGVTWSKPIDLMEEITRVDTGDPIQEGVFGSIGNVVDDYIHITYQRDHLPGLNIMGDMDPITKNKIVYLKVPKSVFNLSTDEVLSNDDFELYPNPCDKFMNIRLNENERESVVKIINILGETIWSQKVTNPTLQINTESLEKGVYMVSIETPNKRRVKSFVKH